MKKENLKKYLLPGLMIAFTVIFLVSAGFVIKYALDSNKQKDNYDDLANMVEQIQQQIQQEQQQQTNPNGSSSTDPTAPISQAPPLYTEITHPETGEKLQILREYAPVFQLNTDMVGWIKLPGTKLNYPVVQTPDSPNYYLKRDFYKKSSRHGTVYANELANLATPSDNVTLYGHNMNDGSMFAPLHGYNKKAFFEENPYIIFDTIYEHHTYQIFAVFYTTDIVGDGFAYHTFVDGNAISFVEFVDECKALSLYDTGVEVSYGDKLLTLSTCDKNYADDHGRFVVVAKRIA